VAAVVVLPFALRTGKMSEVTTKGWVLIVAMAVTSGMVSHGLLAWAQRRVPVSTISVLQLAQPGIATTWAFLFLDQHVKPVQLLGMAIVIVAVAFVALGTARRAQQDNTARRAQHEAAAARAAADLAARSIIDG
jgi:drug/metabolite transporter (DMT)-like permease